jgi:hypothetical protein
MRSNAFQVPKGKKAKGMALPGDFLAVGYQMEGLPN